MEPIKANNFNNDLPVQVGNVNEQESPIHKIPPEILKVIFSQMDNLEKQQLNSVSTLWNVEVLNAVKEQEFTLLNSFVTLLIENLKLIAKNPNYEGLNLKPNDIEILIQHFQEDKHSEVEREARVEVVTQGLANILKNTKITQPFDLFKIKSSLVSVKNEIINLLVALDHDFTFILLKILNDEKMPATWGLEVFPVYGVQEHEDEIFELVRYLQIAKMHPSSEGINSVSKILFDFGYLNRAIELTKTITVETQTSAFKYIIKELINYHHFEKASQVAIENLIHPKDIEEVINRLANHGKVDLVIKVCNSINDIFKRDTILYHVNSVALRKNDYEGSIKLYALINDDQIRSEAKNKIIEKLSEDAKYLQTHPDLLIELQKL